MLRGYLAICLRTAATSSSPREPAAIGHNRTVRQRLEHSCQVAETESLECGRHFALLSSVKTGSDQWLRSLVHSGRWPRIVPVVTDLVPAMLHRLARRENRRSVWRAVVAQSRPARQRRWRRRSQPQKSAAGCFASGLLFPPEKHPQIPAVSFSDPAGCGKFARAGRVLAKPPS